MECQMYSTKNANNVHDRPLNCRLRRWLSTGDDAQTSDCKPITDQHVSGHPIARDQWKQRNQREQKKIKHVQKTANLRYFSVIMLLEHVIADLNEWDSRVLYSSRSYVYTMKLPRISHTSDWRTIGVNSRTECLIVTEIWATAKLMAGSHGALTYHHLYHCDHRHPRHSHHWDSHRRPSMRALVNEPRCDHWAPLHCHDPPRISIDSTQDYDHLMMILWNGVGENKKDIKIPVDIPAHHARSITHHFANLNLSVSALMLMPCHLLVLLVICKKMAKKEKCNENKAHKS